MATVDLRVRPERSSIGDFANASLAGLASNGLKGMMALKPELQPENLTKGVECDPHLRGIACAGIMAGAAAEILKGLPAGDVYRNKANFFRNTIGRAYEMLAQFREQTEATSRDLAAMSEPERTALHQVAKSFETPLRTAGGFRESLSATISGLQLPLLRNASNPITPLLFTRGTFDYEARKTFSPAIEAQLVALFDSPTKKIVESGAIIRAPFAGLGKAIALAKRLGGENPQGD